MEVLGPVADRFRRYMAEPLELDHILADGAEKASAVAEPILDETRRIVGFWRKIR